MELPLPLALLAQQALDLALRLDPDSRGQLDAMDGKLIRFVVQSPALTFSLSVVDQGVQLMRNFDGEADTTLTGTAAAFASLAQGNDAVYSGAIRIDGDLETAQHLRSLLGSLSPDWEEWLAPYLGDAVVRKAGVAGATARRLYGQGRGRLRDNVSEYLQEEAELLVPGSEVRHFENDVDHTRAALDRLEARVAQLEKSLPSG